MSIYFAGVCILVADYILSLFALLFLYICDTDFNFKEAIKFVNKLFLCLVVFEIMCFVIFLLIVIASILIKQVI